MAEESKALHQSPGTSTTNFRISAPQVSAPKGGGALHGIGEKFSANPVTGTASVSVPIYSTPGRTGSTPQLTLSYDSGAGNGPFGFGWDLALPAITRKTDKGLPRYADAEESDVFLLSGAEDLVPELREVAADDWQRVEEDRVLYGQHYLVRRYRPRVEGLFARIERWSSCTDKTIVFWRSITRDNTTTWYGRTAESRITDPEDAARIFSWLICESYDDRGNATFYRYAAENSDDVDAMSAHERNRTAASRSTNRYLKRVQYGNRVPYTPDLAAPAPAAAPVDWCFELVFDYGEHDSDVPLPVEAGGTWTSRPDPFSHYRAGFEVRTYRLCHRVLMFHHFPAAADVGANCLVRSTDITYSHELQPADPSNPIYAFLKSVRQTGYRRDGGGYRHKSMPPVEFDYSEPVIDPTVRTADAATLENLPQGLDGRTYQWVDLDGEGVCGVLTEQAGAWHYKRNLSPAPAALGGGAPWGLKLAALERITRKPSLAALSRGRQQLIDLAGDGQLDLVDFESVTPGFYERTEDADWDPFQTFRFRPHIDWTDPNLKFIDLTGDGHADILITEDAAFCWHESLAESGFGPAQRTPQSTDEERGPQVVFADQTESIFIADLSGDGLSDIVRIRNGDICYWPNLGYGRFGAKVTMDHAPHFESPDLFDGRRMRLTDIDGSGTADIIYFASRGAHVYYNQSGNAWSPGHPLETFPAVDASASAVALDLLGNGTACLVWSSPLPAHRRKPLRYIDLMGGVKPHLLIRVDNNMGAETRVQFAPSTRFYVADRLAGRPWITRLPFSVHVVERVEVRDYVSRNRFVTRYAYHHGHFNGVEREFCGFGMVEQWDTEELASLTASTDFPAATNVDAASYVPPILTRTWFHTGVYLGREHVSDFFAGLLDATDKGEYYREPGLTDAQARARLLPDTVLPSGWNAEDEREACRALKGSMLRQETYALDGSDQEPHPYVVIEQNFSMRRLQPHGDQRHGVFLTFPREALNYHYERDPTDPRVSHAMTLEVDAFGNVLRSLAIGYGRRVPDPALSATDQLRQAKIAITYSESEFTNDIDIANAHRLPLVSEVRTYEITGFASIALLSFDDWTRNNFQLIAGLIDIPYESTANPAQQQKRLIERVATRYRSDDLTALLPKDALQPRGTPGETYKLAMTPGLIASLYVRQPPGGGPVENLVSNAALVLGSTAADGGGYIDFEGDGNWWVQSGRAFYSTGANAANPAATAAAELAAARAHFFLQRKFVDPFGNESTVQYDADDLLIAQGTDAVGNVTSAEHDYRVMQPFRVTDLNGNRSEAAFDVLGMVAGTAVRGKVGENLGDRLDGFVPDLTQPELDAFYAAADPQVNAVALLADATTRSVYDLDRFMRTRAANPAAPATWLPIWSATIARETHFFDLAPGQTTGVQVSFNYSDGLGRDIQKKAHVDAGPLVPAGAPVAPRWLSSGWAIFNNKGKPVRQYEPFFSATHRFEYAVTVGVSPILFYDPIGRVVATLHADHTWEKIVFSPWRQETWDASDLTLVADPANDSHAGPYFVRLPTADYLPTWYARRVGGALGAEHQSAAAKSAIHAGTPAIAHLDPLARIFVTVTHNRFKRSDSAPAAPPIEEFYTTRVIFDIEGNTRAIFDARDLPVMRYDYDMLGVRVRQESMDAGVRWMLSDVLGKAIRGWDSRNHLIRNSYDPLRRPLGTFLHDGAAAPVMVSETTYGETQPAPHVNNLRGKAFELRDQAGVVTSDRYDFKGNLNRTRRQLAQSYKTTLDWNGAIALEPEVYESRTRHDALNRPTELVAPDGSTIHPRYKTSGLLDAIDVNIRGAAAATSLVTDIDYDPKGQRRRIRYGNGTSTEYEYDPETFRLTHFTTSRAGFPVADSVVQDLTYVYDASANITHIRDDAQQTIFFRNQRVEPGAEYTYDATYRLIEGTGREHLGQIAAQPAPPTPPDAFNVFHIGHLQPGDGHAMGTYREQYFYDAVGNILAMRHRGTGPAHPGWRRCYQYALDSNRLLSTSNPSVPHNADLACPMNYGAAPVYTDQYTYDAHGNILRMSHLPLMQWDYRDQLQATSRQVANAGPVETTWYVYDAGGQRVRKVTELANGQVKDQRIYLGTLEIYRRAGANPLTRETLHVIDDRQRVALVETRTDVAVPEQLIRYQFANHMGTALLELDDKGLIISYEEYTPFGTTSYQAVRSQTETPKRYRFTARERDEENGFYYNDARYYCPWIGRWTASDPTGAAGGHNLYTYCRNSPLVFHDPQGTQEKRSDDKNKDIAAHATTFGAALVNLQKDSMPFTAMGKGLREAKLALNVDEILAVANGGSWSDPANKQFLDWMTNQFTKNAGIGSHTIPARPQISLREALAKGPEEFRKASAELMTRRFSEVEELEKITNDAAAAMKNTNRVPRKLADAINKAIRGRIAREATGEAKIVAKALREAGFDPKTLTAIRNEADVVAKAASEGGAVAKTAGFVAKAAPVVSKAVKVLAPAAKVLGKVATPVAAVVNVVQFATAKTTDDYIDASISATSTALMAAPHPVAKAAGAGLAAGQLIDKTLDVSDHSAAAGVWVYEKLSGAGVNDTAAFVAGGAATVLAIPSAIGYGAAEKISGWFR
ncbi:SpvB/TcaC N-terminal domain-containing protein [Caballeronia zhejiangensis]|uniref:SpvB/TcaC N-terminal domain-containing protein n=1 Tax=Caballeronia zhejiangensis TaxID=871203 RepID=UPI001EF5B1AA|nr:SpvB/TcaC N-terminal domain-containing protein [Caballeronia zhejiangensis]MCG7405327.1 toxin [Caballeronia zhejiangensis]